VEIRLCEEDQKHFGCPEWLDFDLRNVTVADMEELSERFGFDPDDWPEPFYGQLTLEQAGDPDAKPKPPRWQGRAVAWLALRQNGFPVLWDEAGAAHYMLIQTRRIDQEQQPRGKEDMPETPSPPSEPSTTTPSSTSGQESPETA